jgi:hypothetical protein
MADREKNNGIPIWLEISAAVAGIVGSGVAIHQAYFNPTTQSNIVSPPNIVSKSTSTEKSSTVRQLNTLTQKAVTEQIGLIVAQPDNFYFVDDSAFSDTSGADKELKKLKAKGFDQAGKFWIPDYPNLSGKKLFEVYPARFNDRNSCASFLLSYRTHNLEAYCAFASKNRNKNPDRFYSIQN